jgi:hypothetical protein
MTAPNYEVSDSGPEGLGMFIPNGDPTIYALCTGRRPDPSKGEDPLVLTLATDPPKQESCPLEHALVS